MDERDLDGTGPSLPPADEEAISAEEFASSFGENLRQALDLRTWQTGEDLTAVYDRLAREIQEAVRQEGGILEWIRTEIFPRLAGYPGSPPQAGVWQADPKELEWIHRGLLFNGGVEACDGTRLLHDTLPLTIFQLGVSLVSYQGNQGTWSQRLYRRDLRASAAESFEDLRVLFERRDRRAGQNQVSRHDQISELAQRGILAYAERAILLGESKAPWRMGHGNPAPYELVTGHGSMDLMVLGTRLIRDLVERHQKFVYVSSEPGDRVLLTIGQALKPLQYAIVSSLKEQMAPLVAQGHFRGKVVEDLTWDGEKLAKAGDWIARFRDVVGPKVVVGVFRATSLAPAQVFYAHADYAHEAANIALADSILQEHRGFPLLIDLADAVCGRVFGRASLAGPVDTAYTRLGAPWRFQSERMTRGTGRG